MQWADPGVKLAHFSPVSPFGPALVPVLPRADRAVRTVSPAACTHVTCAVWMCHDTPCMSMFVKVCGLIILPQILGSLPEVIRSWCAHHHHHHHHTRSSRGRFEWSARFHRPSRRVAGPGKRHSARGTPRAQPRDVRSAGRDTWNLTGEALGGPRKRSWRRCSRARSGSRSAIRGAHSGALDRPEPSDPAARAPIRTSAPYSAADASGSSCAAGARLR